MSALFFASSRILNSPEQWANAQVVYTTIAQQTLYFMERVQDEGQLAGVIDDCIAGLIACLEAQSHLPRGEQLDKGEREELLATLFSFWRAGEAYGLDEVDIPEVLAGNSTEQERAVIEQWVRQEMRSGQDFASKRQNRRAIAFLAALQEDRQVGAENLLEEYRKAGLYPELGRYLLQLGKEQEALDTAREQLTEPLEVIRFAEQLLPVSEVWRAEAFTFVETRLEEASQALADNMHDVTGGVRAVETYRRWLGEQYRQYGKVGPALEMELARFQVSPDENTYRSIRSVAQLPEQPEECWSNLRPQLIQTLERHDCWEALTALYLDEQEVGQALTALTRMKSQTSPPPYGYGSRMPLPGSHIQLRVAQAAEEEYPDESLRLYKQVVQRLIDSRGRGNYQQAVTHLQRVKELCQRQGHEAEWQTDRTDLRNNQKHLRALREELDKSGL